MSRDKITHNLKIYSEFFDEILLGNKNFEIRKNDRDFHKGDIIVLKELSNDEEVGGYTGREITADITIVTTYGQVPGFAVLGIRVTGASAEGEKRGIN